MPPISSGQPKVESVKSQPEIIEPAAQAKVFGTAVILAAAGRSGGVTTAITYEVLVGTSICDSALRSGPPEDKRPPSTGCSKTGSPRLSSPKPQKPEKPERQQRLHKKASAE